LRCYGNILYNKRTKKHASLSVLPLGSVNKKIEMEVEEDKE
jgi:hypothetical protein